jgi:uncharacterized protein (DUF1697 family)
VPPASISSGSRDSVTRYVALLRAVNVGGRNSLPMGELRAALCEHYPDVATVLQSGNVLLTSGRSASTTASDISRTIEDAFGLRVTVVVRSAAEIESIVRRNPFSGADVAANPAHLHVAFLEQHPAPEAISSLDATRSPPDAFVVSGCEVYLAYPNGSARTRLTLDYLETRLGVAGTARNWRTVGRLADLLVRT